MRRIAAALTTLGGYDRHRVGVAERVGAAAIRDRAFEHREHECAAPVMHEASGGKPYSLGLRALVLSTADVESGSRRSRLPHPRSAAEQG